MNGVSDMLRNVRVKLVERLQRIGIAVAHVRNAEKGIGGNRTGQ